MKSWAASVRARLAQAAVLLLTAVGVLSLFCLPAALASHAAAGGSTPTTPPTATQTTETPLSSPTPSSTATGTPTATASPEPSPSPTLTGPAAVSPTVTVTPVVRITVTVAITNSTTATPSPTPSPTPTPVEIRYQHAAGEVIVRFGPAVTTLQEAEALVRPYGASVKRQLAALDMWVLGVETGQVGQAIALLRPEPAVLLAEPNYLAYACLTPNDPDWPLQSYLLDIQAPQAWEITTGSPAVVIAVLDTGVDTSHPDLAAKLWANPGEAGGRQNGLDDDGNGYVDDWRGWNSVNGTGLVQDDHGHGTQIAGVAAADTDNGVGMAGVAWGARIMPLKVLDTTGTGTHAQIAEGIVYAAREGAQVINLSLSSPAPSALLAAAIEYASQRGVILVAAAGNTGSTAVGYPAAYPQVIAVGAAGPDEQLASFSSFGSAVNLLAPGTSIYTTQLNGGYARQSGTSLAAAQVSGVAALLTDALGASSPAKVREALLVTAASAERTSRGAGLVQAHAALSYLSLGIAPARPTLTPTPTPTPKPYAPAPRLPIPTPTSPPPAPTSQPGPIDPHVNYSASPGSCAGCHRAHTAGGPVLRQQWPEEELCFACHSADGPGTDVEAIFDDTSNSAGQYFKHDVAATNGVHRPGESDSAAFGGSSRHVECEDCHEPHEATRGTTSAPMLPWEMNGTTGVEPQWAGPGAPAGYDWLFQAEREFQVCFKCHSGFTTLPTYLPAGWDGRQIAPDGLRKLTSTDPSQVRDSRDLAREFNPHNASFHPVVAPGRNQSIPAGSFVAGWSQFSLLYCSDCHHNPDPAAGGEGPHGSANLHLLAGTANYQTAAPDAQPNPPYTGGEVCFNCHRYQTYVSGADPADNTNFRKGTRNLHQRHANNGSCYLCHDSHGSEQLHLLNLDLSISDAQTYLLDGYDGQPTDSQSFWQISPDGTEKSCWLVCHNKSHSNRPYPNGSD